jgi:hypothetical protein
LPGFLSGYSGFTRLTFGDEGEWWVEVRDHLRRGEFKSAQQALVRPIMRYEGVGDKATASTSGAIDTQSYQNELVISSIIAWNLTDEAGNELPLAPDAARRASVDLLPTEVFDRILDHVTNGTPGADAKKAKEEAGASEDFRPDGSAGALPDEGRLGAGLAG